MHAIHTHHSRLAVRTRPNGWMVWLLAAMVTLLSACGGGGDDPIAEAVAPILTISSNVVGVADTAVTVRFLFSADVASFASNRFALSGGSIATGSFTQVSAREFTVVINPNTNREGQIQMTVPAGAFADVTGKAGNKVAYSFAQAYDTRQPSNEPTVSITDDSPNTGIATGAIKLTFTFNMDIGASFTLDDLDISIGTVGALTRQSSTVYTLLVTPPAGTSGAVLITLRSGTVTGVPGGVSNADATSHLVFFAVP